MNPMTAQSSNGARGHARGAWRWKSTDQAQGVILAAACDLFTAHGFSNVTVADITARADASVGSLYHHFGGKDELYFKLWRNYGLAHDQASIGAVVAAQRAGITDPAELLAAGARAVLEETWTRRDLAGLFFAGDGPPGFEAMRHDHRRRLSRHVDMLLRIPHTPGNQLYATSVLCVIGEGAREIASARTLKQAQLLTDAVLRQSRCLMTGGPARPENGQCRPFRPARAAE
jgi:AcrR family transcriptional regulator